MKKSKVDFGFVTHLLKSQRHLERKLNGLDYADDIALLEQSFDWAQNQLNETGKSAKKVGLDINVAFCH